MRVIPAALALMLALSGGAAALQDPSAEALRRIDKALREESERLRAELGDLVRRELKAPPAAAIPLPAKPAPVAGTGRLEDALKLVTVDLLKKHATFLASDELEGRAAGYPGNEKAAEYIVKVMKDAGLKPGGDAGGYLQKFRVLGGRETNNVVGLIEGSDPELRKEFVVAGAHFDHVGTSDQKDYGRLGGRGDDKIWNGADDNASGTTTVLGLVRAFGEGGLRTKRTLVFIAFSGEEAGLYGSAHYTSHPAGPIGQHVYMLNLDMVGRNPHKPMEIYGVGSAEGGAVRKIVEKAVETSGLSAKVHDDVKLVGGDSDHSSFRDKGVPFTFFFSGFHADYHRPSDHPEKLSYDNMLKVAQTSAAILSEVGNLAERPRFSGKAGGGLVLPDFLQPGKSARRLGVQVQELDDTECDALKLPKTQGALRVDDVSAGSVAEASGIKAGDYLLSVGGKLLERSGARAQLPKILTEDVKPGREIEVVVLRGGERVPLKAKWSE